MVTKLGRVQRVRGFAIVISEKSNRGDKYNVNANDVLGWCTPWKPANAEPGSFLLAFSRLRPIGGASQERGVGSGPPGLGNWGGGIVAEDSDLIIVERL
jgi:hypothetical protein